MNKSGIDLIGEVSLLGEAGRMNPIKQEYWGHGNLEGEERNDSYAINLIDKEELSPGEKCKAEFRFMFSDHVKFEKRVREGQVIELNEGSRKIGEFTITKIINQNLLVDK